MLLILPVIVLGLLVAIMRRMGEPWRRGVLLAMAGWGLMQVVMIEGLSVPRWLTAGTIAGAWAVAAVGLGMVWWRKGRKAAEHARATAGVVGGVERLSWVMRVGLGVLVGVLGVLLVIAMMVPPNSWDSMTYHLPRVMHWIQNQSVAPYPTHIVRQVQQPPFAEYAVMQTMLLWGNDRFANVPQHIAMLGCLVGVSLIAKQLGASVRGQALAAIVAGTMPMLMLQSTSTQIDCVNAFWVCASVALGMEVVFGDARPGWLLVVGLGACCGLALFAKATAYLYIGPALCVGVALLVWRYGRRGVMMGACVAGLMLAINLPHYARNLSMTGLPLGPTSELWEGKEYPYRNRQFTVAGTASNLVRNVTDEIGTPWYRWNQRIYKASVKVHEWLGLNSQNPDYTWSETRYGVAPMWSHEDYAPSPLHFVLLVLAAGCAGCWGLMPRGHRWRTAGYVVLLGVMFVGFSGYLRWQMWHCRLLLPWMVLGMPLIAVVVDRVWRRPGVYVVMIGLFVAAAPYLLWAQSRPLLGERSVLTMDRWAMRCWNSGSMAQRYQRLAERVRTSGAQNIGMIVADNVWEYPLWVALREAGVNGRIEHVQVTSYAAPLANRAPFAGFRPDGVLNGIVYTPATRSSGVQ